MKTIKQNLLLTITSLILCSCIIDEIGSSSNTNITFVAYWKDDILDYQDFKNSIIVENDTLSLKNLNYVISNLKLISQSDTINVIDYKLMKSFDNLNIENVRNEVYRISFNFGIEDVNNNFPQLKAQNFDIEEGYYYIKMSFRKKGNDSLYNYNIAKKSNNSLIKSFKVNIDGFKPTNGYIGSKAVIGLNLKNLFIKSNHINIDSLTTNNVHNENLQIKMTENAQNIFYLEKFQYD